MREWIARAAAVVLSVCVPVIAWSDFQIIVTDASPQADFAANEIELAGKSIKSDKNWRVQLRLASGSRAKEIQPEGYRIERHQGTAFANDDAAVFDTIEVLATDPAGLMYGGLEVAERIRTTGIESIEPESNNPYMKLRGTKFNIPLDVRTPSYSDMCDAAQKNLPEMWNEQFWKDYIDSLARYRYNFVSLWNLHPFPSMVKVPEYPDVALQDVWRSNIDWDENYDLQGRGFVTDKILSDVEVVHSMTIEQKIDFWRRVMAYGKSRNVNFYVVTWNIFTYGTFGKYGITDAADNENTKDYFRHSVKQMLLTYPDLAGVGLTTGENMHGVDFQGKEDWAMATYGQGVLDAAAANPDRKITLIHRQHMAKADDIARTFKQVIDHPNVEFLFSFKYAKAHVYSATTQPYHEEFVKDLGDELKTIWTLRNDDNYYFRWGAPDFVREFVRNIPYDVSQGYYYGSDQYAWGREFLQRDAAEPRQLEIEKHFLQWMLWGRLGYDVEMSNQRFAHVLAERFELPYEDAVVLLDAWQCASMIYPVTTGFHWGPLDFQWYIEGCQSRAEYARNKTGFHDVNRFIDLPPHPKSGYQSIPHFVAGRKRGPDEMTPLQVADLLDKLVQDSKEHLRRVAVENKNEELRHTISDIAIITELGAYYADKIRGATQLAIYRESNDEQARTKAVESLKAAASHWKTYSEKGLNSHHNPLWTNRVGIVDWQETYDHVLQDIVIASEQ